MVYEGKTWSDICAYSVNNGIIEIKDDYIICCDENSSNDGDYLCCDEEKVNKTDTYDSSKTYKFIPD